MVFAPFPHFVEDSYERAVPVHLSKDENIPETGLPPSGYQLERMGLRA